MPFRRRLSRREWAAAKHWRENHAFVPGGGWDPELPHGRFAEKSTAASRLWIPVVISFFVQVPQVFFEWAGRGERLRARPLSDDLLVDLVVALIGPISLIAARRLPGPVVAVVAAAASADLLLAEGGDGPPYISLAFAIGSAIVRGARVWAWAAIAVSWVGTIVLALAVGFAWQPWRIVGVTIGILLIVGAAEGIRARKEHAEQIRTRIASRRQSEVQAERVRIARELHDVLAHSLSQINVQAGVGLHLMDKQPEKAAAALASIKETSKVALDEVRSVLGVLRAEGGADPSAPLVPEPDLSRLPGLIATVETQGLSAKLSNEITGAPQSVELALYRIVQESLTNVVRHAGASSVAVALSESATEYRVEIVDDGSGTERAETSGGRGLLGMRERAELLGGSLEAGPRTATTGFRVAATIPKKEHP